MWSRMDNAGLNAIQEIEKELNSKLSLAVQFQKSLKILFAMIRSPKLCNLMFKEERKRYSKLELEKLYE